MKHPSPLYDTRKHYAYGIYWRGYIYESVPQLANVERLLIVEDHDTHLVVADYKRPCSWHDKCVPCDEQYMVKRIGVGRPTKERLLRLKLAINKLAP